MAKTQEENEDGDIEKQNDELFQRSYLKKEEKRLHECSICGHNSKTKNKMKIHIDSVHEGKKPHKCSFCDKSFSQKGSLILHISSVHEQIKPNKCPICGYSTS